MEGGGPDTSIGWAPASCRVTVIEGSGATHVDYTIARVNPGA